MSYFSAEFTAIMKERGWKNEDARIKFNIAISTVSLYANAERSPRPEQLANILRALDHDERTRLMYAVHRDAVPGEEFADLVLLERTGEGSKMREEALAAWKKVKLSPQAEADIETIAAAIATHADIEKAAHSFAEFIRNTTVTPKKK